MCGLAKGKGRYVHSSKLAKGGGASSGVQEMHH